MKALTKTPLNRSKQLPATYKRPINGVKQNKLRENDWATYNLTNNKQLLNYDIRRIATPQGISSLHS